MAERAPRLEGKVAIITGAGSSGEGIGNGRAAAILMAREGARVLLVVRGSPDSHPFEVLPRRWVVERTLAWLSRCRRLSKDYEELPETGEAWVHIAMVHLMLKRLKPT